MTEDIKWLRSAWAAKTFYVIKVGKYVFAEIADSDGGEVFYAFTDQTSAARYQILIEPNAHKQKTPVQIQGMALNEVWNAYAKLLLDVPRLSVMFATIDGSGHLDEKDILFTSLPRTVN